MKTLYVSDLDGTLLTPQAVLSTRTKEILNQILSRGVHFCYATARMYSSTSKIFEGVAIDHPVILKNGALIFDIKSQRYIYQQSFTQDIMQRIVAVLLEQGKSGYFYTLKNNRLIVHYENLDDATMRSFYHERTQAYDTAFEQVVSFMDLPPQDTVYFTAMGQEEPVLALQSELAKIQGLTAFAYADMYDIGRWYLECFSDKASKYYATQFLRQHDGYDRVIGFGDQLNDIPLFAACDEAYAVQNAAQELKDIATGIIGRSDQDAVALWLQNHA